MRELQLGVKWDLEGVSASRNLLEKTAIAVRMDTITTLSAFVSLALSLSPTGDPVYLTGGRMSEWAVGKHRGECAKDLILMCISDKSHCIA